MTEIEQKALALVNAFRAERGWATHTNFSRYDETMAEAICRAIEQHEAFRQEVSDVVEEYIESFNPPTWHRLEALIIPAPKPDPLVDVVKGVTWYDYEITAKELRAALDARGLEIREKNDD